MRSAAVMEIETILDSKVNNALKTNNNVTYLGAGFVPPWYKWGKAGSGGKANKLKVCEEIHCKPLNNPTRKERVKQQIRCLMVKVTIIFIMYTKNVYLKAKGY